VVVSGSSGNNGEPPKPKNSKRGMKREKRREAWRKRKADGKEARAAKAARLGGACATTGDPTEVAPRKPDKRTVAKEAQRAVARSILGLGRSVCQMSLRLSNHGCVWGVSPSCQPFSSTFNHAASQPKSRPMLGSLTFRAVMAPCARSSESANEAIFCWLTMTSIVPIFVPETRSATDHVHVAFDLSFSGTMATGERNSMVRPSTVLQYACA
jgi:hypothetical protein